MTNIHDGHRKRMRERFRREGLAGFAPHEVLELLLFYGRARGDVNPTAHALLDAFGSLKGVMEARPEQLMTVSGVGEESATLISLMLPLWRRYTACVLEEKQRIENRRQAQTYCLALLSGLRTEHFYLIALSADAQVLGRRLVAEGSLSEVNAYPRTVVEAALNYNAHSVILCHNHPGGSAQPSQADIDTTLILQELLSALGVTLLDHMVVAGDEAYSMMQHGDLDAEGAAARPVAADSTGRMAPKRPVQGTKAKEQRTA